MRLPRLSAFIGLIAFTAAPAALAQEAPPVWDSGFENGFPGEFLDYDDGSYTESGVPISGKAEAWTIVDDNDPLVTWGHHAYKGWPVGPTSDTVHRCYPVVYLDVPSPVVNSFMAYIDADFSQVSSSDWIHLATWSNNPDWNVFTMSVRNKKIEMAHLDWDYVGPMPQPDYPLRKWVRLTAYMEFNGASTLVEVWQDGVHILEGTFTNDPGLTLQRVHWGWYSSAAWTEGVEYNDEIQVWTLSEKLTDFTEEPPSPYDPPDGSGGTGGTGGNGGSGGSGGSGGKGGTGNATGGNAGVGDGDNAGDSPGGATASGGSSSGGSAGQSRGGSAGRGTGGASTGGTTTNGGSMNATGGMSASSTGGTADTAGSAGRPSGGASNGGTSNGGSATHGGTSSGGASGSGATPTVPNEDDNSGCGCRTAPHGSSSLGWLALGALGLASFTRRRSPRRSGRARPPH